VLEQCWRYCCQVDESWAELPWQCNVHVAPMSRNGALVMSQGIEIWLHGLGAVQPVLNCLHFNGPCLCDSYIHLQS